jgi:rhodanese-related sulfurtransferase
LTAATQQALALQIAPEDVAAWRMQGVPHHVLDVREPWEVELCRIDGSIDIPMGDVPAAVDTLPADAPLVVVCHHGMRSMQVVSWPRGQGMETATNLAGGIDLWAQRVDPAMRRY